MNDGYVKTDPWRLVEDRFDPSRTLSSESLFALGNGVMGGRANFEERYSGETLQGNYIGGVYYPDKTRVGWWKNGYPEYFAKVPNAAFWIGVDVAVDGEPLDLATVAEVKSFYRETDMRRSVLTRRMRVVLKNGVEVAVETVRFLSLARRELLVYRYNQLDKAIENAAKLGFRDGAALYPMVTVNGEECHNEWEITFEEIHRNGAVAYAIFNYIRYTGDTAYLADCGLEVLLSVARFWAQRITWSGARRKYVMLGVTGPNEYENNVDNNWYTSYIACWSMRYAAESAAWVRENRPADYARICAKRRFDETAETKRWLEIADGMYFGEDRELGIFLQQDGYLDKEQTLAKDLDPADRPINQRWSWDRILRSCLIKQADVLQGLYFFGDDFDLDTVRRNFRFYEARTVHESSLSPCVHAILAARIGDLDKAYELYLRTARLDLDDYNREVREGCHVTSMAGSWLSVVEGFGGMRVRDGVLSFDPQLPAAWESLSFKVNFQDRVLTVRITRNAVEVANEGAPVELEIRGVRRLIADKVIMNCEL